MPLDELDELDEPKLPFELLLVEDPDEPVDTDEPDTDLPGVPAEEEEEEELPPVAAELPSLLTPELEPDVTESFVLKLPVRPLVVGAGVFVGSGVLLDGAAGVLPLPCGWPAFVPGFVTVGGEATTPFDPTPDRR
ncbi:hypothetical protein AV654_03170 [Paenibacillus elgii]|uniref:Uncharacterized protein n=1 Tax=Paenibacillus elgii TaxID=189691 RepID=A0A163VDA4_9BACL|nr:hypothetical protein AV654_03170 [Paenibacillus elgii]